MDFVKWGAAGILAVAFAGAVMVQERPTAEVAMLALPAICGDTDVDHGGTSMQAHLDAMAEHVDEARAALIQTMEPMHSDMMRGMTAAEFGTAFVCSMIPHHQGAVEMAQVAQAHSDDPWILMFAQGIIAEQQMEIRDMKAWLARQAPDSPPDQS
jgi:uncharacterized protein (DUF305 family)